MRYFVPNICVTTELPAQSSLEDKLGGRPWGLRASSWPVCRDCGRSQSLLAQFVHHPVRLDLGRQGRALFVFQCNHDPGLCRTWEADSKANACFVVEPEDLASGLTAMPMDHPAIEHEVRAVDWLERDDGLPDSLAPTFFDDKAYDELDRESRDRVTWGTRLAGVPRWLQSPADAPSASTGWRFIGQLDSTYSFLRPPSVNVPWVSGDADRWEGRTHLAVGPNFGDGGIAYLFLSAGPACPEGLVFWQCL
jgi:hypothetical protein